MKIKFLGTVGYRPTEHRHTSCVMLPEEGIVLDAGTGFFRVGANIQTKHLDVLLSHYHPDHINGLTYMLSFYKTDLKDVTVYGPKGIKGVEKKLNFPIKFKDHPFKISLKKIEKEFNLDDVVVQTKLFPHLDQVSVGYRLEKEGKSLCYLTDMVPSEESIEFAKNSNVLIHECYFYKSEEELAKQSFHSYTTQVAEMAKKAGVEFLVLYHLNPLVGKHQILKYVHECKEIFKNTILPRDNLEVEI